MPTVIRKPVFRIWIKGRPRSIQGEGRRLLDYQKRIHDSALNEVPYPVKSTRIDIEIYYSCKRNERPDVDNIAKPILDALKGVVYLDDKQVRSLHIMALPHDEVYGISDWVNHEIFARLMKTNPREFLIEIFEGTHTFLGPS
jgi:Holliday junction resolvase RusA-like endonuclease